MSIWYAPYQLVSRSRAGLNRLSPDATSTEGFLLRVETNSYLGHGAIHPWPQFGDQSVASQLQALRDNRPTPLITRALAMAEDDGKARSAGRSLFDKLTVPPSHYLVCDLAEFDFSLSGFDTLKIKIGRQPKIEAGQLNNLCARTAFSLRLDANGAFSCAAELGQFLALLDETTRARIEFIEDPFSPSLSFDQYPQNSSTPLALDHGDESLLPPPHIFRGLILKPAKQNPSKMLEAARQLSAKITVTSYLDHPLGQVAAAYVAGQLKPSNQLSERAGVLSAHVYQPEPYSEAWLPPSLLPSPIFSAPAGTGLGFDELLEQEKWQRLR